MKKRKKIAPHKHKSPGRYGLEAAILCILLMAAAYVGSVNKTEVSPQSSRHTVAEQQKNPPRQTPSAPRTKDKRSQAAAAGKSSPVADAREYHLVQAADGDSFVLEDSNKRKIRVRLYGIDAPESQQRFGRQSREHLISLIKGRPLRLKTMYLDNYQRAVSLVYLLDNNAIDELSVNQRQIQAGMAWVYDYFCTSELCKTWKLEEAMAKKQKLGLWKDARPTPPWQWRRSQKR